MTCSEAGSDLQWESVNVQFVTVAEANRKFCEMALLWAWSIRARGGRLADATLNVVFNDRADQETAERLRRESGVQVHVLPRLSPEHPERNKFNGFHVAGIEAADWVVLTDTDMAVCAELDPLASWMLGKYEFGAVPAGAKPEPRLKAGRGLGKLLRRYTGRSGSELEKWTHPWFTQHAPFTRYAYLNGGLFVIQGRLVPEFRARIVEVTRRIHADLRALQLNPWRTFRNQWNRWAHQLHREIDPLIIGYWFSERFADQLAITVTMIEMNLTVDYLPQSMNWRYLGSGHGEELPVRIVHYFPRIGQEAQRNLLRGTWTDTFRIDENPGRRALAEVVLDYRRATGIDL